MTTLIDRLASLSWAVTIIAWIIMGLGWYGGYRDHPLAITATCVAVVGFIVSSCLAGEAGLRKKRRKQQ